MTKEARVVNICIDLAEKFGSDDDEMTQIYYEYMSREGYNETQAYKLFQKYYLN